MKTSLDYLPLDKRERINAVADLLNASAPIGMIILFGSYARNEWVEDLVNGYISDVDIMVVVATKALADNSALWGRLHNEARKLTGRAPLSLVAHDIKHVNQELRMGGYFFADIVLEGVLLRNAANYTLATPKALNAQDRLRLGEQYFRYWFESASEFWRIAGHCGERILNSHAAFLLHQASERYFNAAQLVFSGYKKKTHNLEDLAKITAPFHPVLAGALPRELPEDEHLFDLLKRAYIEARYSMKYRVTTEELIRMREHVLDLARRVRMACAEKLASFCGAEAVGKLPTEPSGVTSGEVPPPPPLDDPEAFLRWGEALMDTRFERGEILRQEGREEGRQEGLLEGEVRGRQEGLLEGEARGRQEGLNEGRLEGQARALVDVLRRRGIAMSDADSERILTCREESMLASWWERALSTSSAAELLDDSIE